MQPNEPTVASSPLRTRYGNFELYVFSWSENEQDNVLAMVNVGADSSNLVRIQSACYTGEIFESLDCDCHWQLETSLSRIAASGGVFIYMLCDGRGAGLLTKIRGMNLTATTGVDTAEAYEELGSPLDPRNYERAAFVLQYLGVHECSLLTNNPRKVAGLESEGIRTTRVPLESEPTKENESYLRSKALKLGHMMQRFGTE
jgi:GTP cyclohydrolase II